MSERHWAAEVLRILIVTAIAFSTGQASEMLETDDFAVVHQKALELGREHGPENVLLVFDIDNTLLASNQPLGSDQWYDWQSDLLKRGEDSHFLVATDPAGLLRAQGALFALGSMHPPQKSQPQIVREVQARQFMMLVLTSRGPQYRNATERHLAQNGYDFTKTEPPLMDEFRGRFMPYSLADISTAGLSAEEAERFDLGMPREVSYDQGVFMTAGLNKGAMLLIFLSHCPRHFSAVVFVDDKDKHTQSVFSALVQRDIEVFTFRYSAEDDEVEEFSDKEKRKAKRHWKRLSGSIELTFQHD